jgi:hypothetical protein
MRRGALLAALLVAVLVPAARAGYSEGGAFHLPQYGARAWARGGAAVASVVDESAVSWNPAMLGLLAGNCAGASYVNLVPGATARQSQLAYAHVLQRDHDGFNRHTVGAMVTNLSLELAGGESYRENFLRLAYAFTPEELVTFAAAGDFFWSTSDVGGFDATGTSIDLAARLKLTRHFSLGAVVRSAFSRYSYDDGKDYEISRAFVFGLATTSVPYATVEGDVVFEHGDMARAIVGAETDPAFDLLSLRGGLAVIDSGEGRTVAYFGFGLNAIRDRLTLHYNANLDETRAFEDTHRFSLSLSL